MRALTVRQPWAEAIACGAKTVENRTMGTHYRGLLVIHAGAAWAATGNGDPRLDILAELAQRPGDTRPRGWEERYLQWGDDGPTLRFDLGAAIAFAQLVDVHEAVGCCGPWGEQHYAASDGKRRTNVRHWVLEDIRRLPEPIPAKGRLGLWSPDPDLATELRLEIPPAA